MRILLNGLVVWHGGHKTYFLNLIPHLGRLGQQHEFMLLHSPWQEMFNFELPPNFTRLVAGPKQRSVLLKVLWEQARLPALLHRECIEAMFSPTPGSATWGWQPPAPAPLPRSYWRPATRWCSMLSPITPQPLRCMKS